jgi:EmrB/QacA subfamily drug resistance transporter
VYVLGLFMNLLDLTITNTALPVLAHDFAASTTSVTWVATGYLLSVAVCIPVSGWLGDRFGTKRTFLFALAVFTLGSLLCGLATGLGSLIAFRVMQGIGGGLLTPVGAAMVFRAFPLQERARVSSIITVPAVVAPALGPVVGGYLVQYASWHWIFLVNVPIGIVGLIAAARYLQEYRVAGTARLDVPGFILAASGLGAFVYALSLVGQRGFTDTRVVTFGVIGLVGLIAFVLVELRAAAPMIDVRLFRDGLFTVGNLTLFFMTAGFFGIAFLMPQFLQAERGLLPFDSGLTTFPTALGLIAIAPVVGRLYPVIGPRRLIVAGTILAIFTALSLRSVGLTSSLWQIRVQMFPLGAAFGLAFIPLQTASFARISPALTGRATAAYTAVRQVATSCGFAVLATVLTARLHTHAATLGAPTTRSGGIAAFHDTFVAAALAFLFALGVALFIRDRLAAQTMRPVPALATNEETIPAAQPLVAE